MLGGGGRLSYIIVSAPGVQGCAQPFLPTSSEIWGVSHSSYPDLKIRKLRLKEAVRYACSHVVEYCHDLSPVTAVPKPCLPMTRAERRGKQDLVERGGAGLRVCGAGEGLLHIGPGFEKPEERQPIAGWNKGRQETKL